MNKAVQTIDLNCDTGEGVGNEEALMPYITACNIACGGHAGSSTSVEQMVALAGRHGVRVGAHPSLPDPENFGRLYYEMPEDELRRSLVDQINLVAQHCNSYQLPLHHIKMHGALYNKCATDETLADLVIDLVKTNFPDSVLYVPYASIIAQRAAGLVKIHAEGFADRNYNGDHTLVSRKQENALITDKSHILQHCLQMITENQVLTVQKEIIPMQINTLCVHGDTPQAVALVKYLYKELQSQNLLTSKAYEH